MKLTRQQFLRVLPATVLALSGCAASETAPASTEELVFDHACPLDYATQFTADCYEGGYTMLTIAAKLNGSIYSLEQRLLIDTSNDKVALVDSLRTLSRCTDADSRERMAYRGEEATLLRKCTRIRYYCKSIHLKTVVVVEAKRLMLDYTWVELEA